MKKILSLFILLFSLLLIYFIFSNSTVSSSFVKNNYDCCETICIYDQYGNPQDSCEIEIVEVPLSCFTNTAGCCLICGLKQGAVYHYYPLCCPYDPGAIPSFTCDGGTIEYHCYIDQKKKK